MPGCVIAAARHNRPTVIIYGGTIRPGSCEGAPQLDLVSAFQSYGKYLQAGKTEEAERERYNTVRHAFPGPGACGGVSICAYIWSHTICAHQGRLTGYNFRRAVHTLEEPGRGCIGGLGCKILVFEVFDTEGES